MPPSPRFAIDAHVIDGKPQGSRTVLIQLLRAIMRQGRASEFLLFSTDPSNCAEAIGDQNINGVAPFCYATLPPGGSVRRLLQQWPTLLRDHGNPVTLFQYIAPPFTRAPLIVSVHDVLPLTHPSLFPALFRWRSQLLFSLSMHRARRITTVSHTAEQEIARRFPSLRSRIRQVTNGPSFDEQTYFIGPSVGRVPPVTRYVLAVGRIEGRKNIDLLVRAFTAAELLDVELVVVGRSDHGHVIDMLHRPGVRHLPQVSDAELVDLYRHASLFVFPSSAEGFGLPLLDALLFGLPVISSDRTAMPEVAGGLAQLFDPTREDAERYLASLIRGHFGSAPIRAPTEAERRTQAARFNWDAAAASLLSTFDEVAVQP